MNGGASQMDTFDYKPELEKRHGQTVDFGIKATATGVPGPIMKSPFAWKQHGQCGRWVSDVFPHIGEVRRRPGLPDGDGVEDQRPRSGQLPAEHRLRAAGLPLLGAWIGYALGRLTDDLPTFVVLPDPRGLPYNGMGNFGSGLSAGQLQRHGHQPAAPVPIPDLAAAPAGKFVTPSRQPDGLDLLARR